MDALIVAFKQAGETLECSGISRMAGDAHVRWMEQYEAIEGHVNQIMETESKESWHEGFSLLSNVLIEAVNNYEVPGVVYHQYCPMVVAILLIRVEQIKNTYTPYSL